MTGPPCFSRFCFRPGATQPSEVLLRASRTGRGPLAGAPPAPGPRLLVCVRSRPSHRGRRLSSDPSVFPDPVHSEQRVGLFSLGVFFYFFHSPPPSQKGRQNSTPSCSRSFCFSGGPWGSAGRELGGCGTASWGAAALHRCASSDSLHRCCVLLLQTGGQTHLQREDPSSRYSGLERKCRPARSAPA